MFSEYINILYYRENMSLDYLYETFYVNGAGERRQHAIFAPGVDRFILVDSTDMWMTLQTAELLSSKLPTMVYILPAGRAAIDNKTCINYTLVDKTQQKVGPSPIAGGQQNPMLKFVRDPNQVADVGMPEDYKNNTEILTRIQRYAQYVHQRVYAMNLAEAMANIKNHARFVDLYLGDWATGLVVKSDRSDLKHGIFFELRKILYLSDSAQQAENRTIEFLKNNIADQGYLIESYYKILGLPVPLDVAQEINRGPKNLSTFLF